ncbi:similar to Kazachstania naganishii KNAG_0J02250 hypothetical protein [Maudiozyma saulgeensis]|uniref:pH-response transcription factor pacC/RIM101 n=1 Tax=Maudiozyma saulgeensis TaxID=1789683 RepID=A0A1X7R442_9SACH|nr:similar to Kazachstania naganishii KNAG_0J02250 hypothetical protein [Kazachstania saulgeensis]
MNQQFPFSNQIQTTPNYHFENNFQSISFFETLETTPFFSNIFVNLYDNVESESDNSENNIVHNRRNLLLHSPLEKVGKVYSDNNFNIFLPSNKYHRKPFENCHEQEPQISHRLPVDIHSSPNSNLRHNSSMTSLISDEALYLNSLHDKIGKNSQDLSQFNINSKNIHDYLLNYKNVSLRNNSIHSPLALDSSSSGISAQCSPSLPITEQRDSHNSDYEKYNDVKFALNRKRSSTSNKCNSPKGNSPKAGTHCCKICGKKFQRPSTLDTHMNIHSGEKPYLCPFLECKKLFNARSNMLRHLKMHFKLGKGKYLLPSGEVSLKKPTAKQLVCFTDLTGDKIS